MKGEYYCLTKSQYEAMPKKCNNHTLELSRHNDGYLCSTSIMFLPYYGWVHDYLSSLPIIEIDCDMEYPDEVPEL